MKWVTRPHAKMDRIACPWLIRRFIDPAAEFLFVSADQVLRVAEREGGYAFDAVDARYTHRDGKNTFEVLIDEYELSDPALLRLARIVHGADIAPDIYDCPEAAGLKALADGFALLIDDDHLRLEQEFAVYDALYAWAKRKVGVAAA